MKPFACVFPLSRACALLWLAISLLFACQPRQSSLRVGVFRTDITPPLGSPVAYAPTRSIVDPLSARGIVILSDEAPIVLCAVDALGIANEGMDAWRAQLATAAHTTPDRVAIHALHQHDGIRSDFTVEKLLDAHGLGGTRYDTPFLLGAIARVAASVSKAVETAQPVSHLGHGKARVEKVASNRRILGPDGKVAIIRWSKATDSLAIAAPEGLIDPWLQSVSFWNNDRPVAVLTYYATHPQSYYGQGDVTAEFVGMARKAREEALGDLPHIHFNGASGNITAGKYNDGSEAMRPILAARMETGMREAWANTKKFPIAAHDLQWNRVSVALPLGKHLVADTLYAILADTTLPAATTRFVAAKHLAWLQQCEAGRKADVSSLRLGTVRLLHLPGELFVEYQLAAQALRPDEEICTAAYGEYGMGYIGTEISYSQGGYETSERASRVSPEVEQVLMEAIRTVLE